MNRFEEKDNEEKDGAQNGDALSMKFLKTRQILLSGEVNKALAEKIVRQLLILEADSDDPIYVYIDSPGGDVNSGYAIFDMIRFVKAPVYTIGMGLVASAGALIYLAAPKERRLALQHSQYLIHQPLCEWKGTATELEINAREIEKTRAGLNKLIAEETGKDEAQVAKDTDRDYWLNAEEAKEYGLVGKIIKSRKDLK